MTHTQTPEQVIELAMKIATKAHGAQTDKSGRPYISHPERVATLVRHSGGTWVQEAAAWLHDVIEDTPTLLSDLTAQGIPDSVLMLVDALTRWDRGVQGFPKSSYTNARYYETILNEPGALLVKLCDIYDNLDPTRMCYLSQADQSRLRVKYAKALLALHGQPVVKAPTSEAPSPDFRDPS